MERHSETISTLSDMQKSLQQKLLNLYSKRDMLSRQVGSSANLDSMDYDKLEREVYNIEIKCEELQ